jgi:excinuclease ABC subunit B
MKEHRQNFKIKVPRTEEEMQVAAASLEYERAALLRDQIMELKNGSGINKIEPKRRPVKYGVERSGRSSKAKKFL